MFRKTIFWIHLAAGVCTGLVIFSMSLTGVLLTYERQMLHWAETRHYQEEPEQSEKLPLEALALTAEQHSANGRAGNIILENHPGAPVVFREGRGGGLALNPWTGEEMEVGAPGMEAFFSWATGFHRWFALQGESRATARVITGASNLVFLFLIFSGMYLWLPSIWKWAMFRGRLLFSGKAMSGKARDFNWHHVFGIWTSIPLAIVVATALVFSYGWANNLVYIAFGEEPPVRGRGPGPGASGMEEAGQPPAPVRGALPLYDLVEAVDGQARGWHTMTLSLPAESDPSMSVAIDYGNGAQPHLRETLTVDRTDGSIVDRTGFDAQSPGQRARSIIRFLHTGEVLGFWGQTIAGIVSFTSLIMVWTGFALAWRRLISPLFRRKAQVQSAG